MGFLSQFAALYVKNALVAWRNRRATTLRLIAPLFFLILALVIDEALQANDSNDTVFKDVKNPESEAINPIPQCREDLFIGDKDCIELTYSPDNAIARLLMENVVKRNPKNISARAFPTRDAVQDFLLANPDYVIGAVHFIFDNNQAANPQLQGFVLQTNTTIKSFKEKTQDPNTFVQLPLQSAVHREIARYQLSLNPSTQSFADALSWYIGLKAFPHPTIATQSVLGQVLGPFIFAACMFSFVTQIGGIAMEKEMGLRQALRTVGMTDASYWLSWGAWEFTMSFLSGHLIAIFGLILQFDLFLNNNYGLLFFLFFLFQLAMSSFALFCAAFVAKTQTAVYLGFLIFIVGWIMQTVVIFGVPYTPDFWWSTVISKILTVIFSIFPWDLLVKGFADLGSATVNSEVPGLKWSERESYCQNIPNVEDRARWADANGYNSRDRYVSFECVLPLKLIYEILIILWIGFFVMAIWFDNIIKNEFGVSRPVFYFCYPSYWFPATAAPQRALEHVKGEEGKGPDEGNVEKDEDVLAEESRMRMLLNHRTGHAGKEGELAAAVDVRNAIEVFGLKKLFGGSSGCCGRSVICCDSCEACSCKAVSPFWPIKGSWFGIEQDQLFCLLGPNGAGKTTTINCLTGALPPTYGDALIYGQSIRSTGGINKIRSLMGVCPQFDVLWPELSGIEHLLLYGRLKGIHGWKAVREEAETLLEKVKLTYAGKQRSGAYSGGMKRRLSVAIALLGDPKVVYLDEPTTGMDPISRRYVWDIIQEAKVGRAIVLTTHSMEEADILGDRIAIMALGRLRCIASSLRLKQRFGAGYQLAVSVQPPRSAAVEGAELDRRLANVLNYFKTRLGLDPTDQGRMYTSFLVPRERESDLIAFLGQLEVDSAALGITDTQLALTSLEEVFLTIARKAALENAQGGGGRCHKKSLPFCMTCLKVLLLGTTLPISIFAAPWWGRFLVGKEEKLNDGNSVQLPDGTRIAVEPGQEMVTDSTGANYKVVWGIDDGGHLSPQEVTPLNDHQAAAMIEEAARKAQMLSASAPLAVAVHGKARVPVGGNVLMEVGVGASYVLNPVDQVTYYVHWARDALGQDIVLSCSPVSAAPPSQQFSNPPGYVPNQAYTYPPVPQAGGMLVAPPVHGHQFGQPVMEAAASSSAAMYHTSGSRPPSAAVPPMGP